MDFTKFVTYIAIFVIFVGGAFTAYQVSDSAQEDAARNTIHVENESISQQYDLWQLTDNATKTYTIGFNDSVSVYNSGGSELVRGTDYEWNASQGTVTFYDTANTTDGAQAFITYNYYENTEQVKNVGGPLQTITEGIAKNAMIVAGLVFALIFLFIGSVFYSKLTSSGPRTRR